MSKGDRKDMRKKVKYIIVLLIIVIIFVLCGSYTKYDESKMPLIVFQFSFTDSTYNYPDTSSMWTIDNQGNIYYFNCIRYFEYEEEEEIKTFYEGLKQEKYARYVGSIDLEVLKEKYSYLHEILRDNHYEKDVSGYDRYAFEHPDVYLGTWSRGAYAVTKKGDIEMIMLHKDGDVRYTSEDERMKELADWLDEVLHEDIEENRAYCQKLKTEENYKQVQEYLKQKQAE